MVRLKDVVIICGTWLICGSIPGFLIGALVYQSNVDSVTGYRRMGTSAEWDRIYDVRHDTCGNTICDRSINRIGYRNSKIVKEREGVR